MRFLIQTIKRFHHTIILVLNAIFLISIAANVVSPLHYPWIGLIGFLFLPLFILHLLIVLFYFPLHRTIAGISLILLIAAMFFIRQTVTYHFTPSVDQGFKVMTWNIRNLDRYNWTENSNTRSQILQKIKQINPDVLCLQEFYTDAEYHPNLAAFKQIGYPYQYFFPTFTQASSAQWGLAIFSKYPITDRANLHINPNKKSLNQAIRATIDYKGKKIDIYCAHFQSLHFDNTDYEYIEHIKHKPNLLNPAQTWQILTKISQSYAHKLSQLTLFNQAVDKRATDRYIICCDLNDIPNSFAYHLIHRNRLDAFQELGRGISHTIPVGLPIFRIDYIFHSPALTLQAYHKVNTSLSDHHIVYTYFNI